MMEKSKNILIVGIGGQGVNTLYLILQELILKAGLFSKGAIFKGGAQKRGAVYAMIRIFETEFEQEAFAPIIPKGELDLLIALEANEVLRYDSFYQKDTQMIINDFTFPFYNERFRKNKTDENVLKTITTHFSNLDIRNFSEQSKALFGHERMINILIGLYVVKKEFIKIEVEDYLDLFQSKLSIPYEDMLKLLDLKIEE